jgi:aminoglycoside phosphotransferase (APT) family kinase protein
VSTGTTPGLDDGAVTAWMESLDIGASGPLTFERIGNGQSNLTFAVSDAAGGRWVLRRPPLGTLLASAHDVAREYRILSALQQTAVPVPTTIALTDDPAVTDAPLVLMSHVDGLVIDSPQLGEEAMHLLSRDGYTSMYRVRLRPNDGRLEWVSVGPEGDDVVTVDEPDDGWWLRFKMWLLSPLAREALL